MEMEDLFERLVAKMDAIRKAAKEEIKADRKTDKEELLARMDTNIKSYQEKTEANTKTGLKELLAIMEADREEWRVGQERLLEVMNAWQEQTTACQYAMETNPREHADVIDRQRIPNEDTRRRLRKQFKACASAQADVLHGISADTNIKKWTLWRGRPPPKRKRKQRIEEEPIT
jgi:hypothetical protein